MQNLELLHENIGEYPFDLEIGKYFLDKLWTNQK
jgi:hypothetical protein